MISIESVDGESKDDEDSLLLQTAADGLAGRARGDHVRKRLSVCLFLHLVGVTIITQVYPKVILEYFEGNDGKASSFSGWLTLVSSAFQFVAIPTVCGASDVVGRRTVLGGSLAITTLSTFVLGLAPSSIVAVSACQILSGVAGAIFPISQAIVIDLCHWGAAGGGAEVTHGLGMIGAAFGLAVSVGPVLGGSLSEFHRRAACVLSSSFSLLAVLSLKFFAWEETAPVVVRAAGEAATTSTNASAGGGWRNCCAEGSAWRVVNPLSVLQVFLDNSLLAQMAIVLACFSVALDVFCVYYNYFDFKYHWDALDISVYFSTLGILLALTSGLLIRFLVPRWLSMERGVIIGMAIQVTHETLFGLAPQGWMLYVLLVATVVRYITEPCIQGVMSTLVGADRQGSLQGAVQSLRLVAQGTAGVLYGQIFSLGVSDRIEKALGFLLPSLPFFCASGFSLTGLAIACGALPKLSGGVSVAEKTVATSVDAVAEEGGMGASAAVNITTPEDRGGDRHDGAIGNGRPTKEAAPATVTAGSPVMIQGAGLLDEDTIPDLSEPLLSRNEEGSCS